MDLALAGKVFVVPAACVGLGRATAEQLVAEGAKVVLVARRPEQLEDAVAACRARTLPSVWLPSLRTIDGGRGLRPGCGNLGSSRRRHDQCGRTGQGRGADHPDATFAAAFDGVVIAALRTARAVVSAAPGPVSLGFVLSTSAQECSLTWPPRTSPAPVWRCSSAKWPMSSAPPAPAYSG